MAFAGSAGYAADMIDDTIAKIQQRLQQSANLSPEKRHELMDLLARLKTEVDAISKADPDQARSIAGFTDLSAHEATRAQPRPETMQSAITGLESTVRGFETAHPQLTAIVGRLVESLSNLGI